MVDSTNISWESAYSISHSLVDVLIFLCTFIWSHVSRLIRFDQMIRSSSVSLSVRSYVRLPLTMQPSCPGLSLVTLRQRNSPSNGKVQTHRDQQKARQLKSKGKSMLVIFFDIKGICSQRINPGGSNGQFRVPL
jgi:hypothetical protein